MNRNSFNAALMILAAAFLYAVTTTPGYTEDGDSAKSISLDQICELYSDYPMSTDNIYGNKTVKTTVEVSSVRKIHSICSDAPEGSFTMEITNKSGTILECFCNEPVYKSVLENTPGGSRLSVEGMYKSMTASYSESENKQCKVTIYNCSFK
ncbi:MAG: hypothetical protein RIG61_12570 [Deltaproteobacteria bacterium]